MIDKLRHQHPVTKLCDLLNVAKSGYQGWNADKVAPPRKLADMRLLVALKAAHQRGRGIYGPKKIRDELAAQTTAPNQVWVADITYTPTDEGWLFLAAIKDLHTCETVGWAMDSRMTKALVVDALRSAYWRKKPQPGLLHHSDRGSQHCAATSRPTLAF